MESIKMKILVFNIKGGCAKSSLSYGLLQIMKDFQIITNDKGNGYNLVLPKEMYYLIPDNEEIPTFSDNDNLIYDFGGYPDKRLKNFILKNKTMPIIIPFQPELLSFQNAISTYNELKDLNNDNIIFVIARAKKNDYDVFKKQMEKLGIKKGLLEIKESKMFQNMWNKNESIKDIENNSLLKHTYKEVLSQLNKLKDEVLK